MADDGGLLSGRRLGGARKRQAVGAHPPAVGSMKITIALVSFCLLLPFQAQTQQCSTSDCAYTGPLEPERGPVVVQGIRVLAMNVYGQSTDFDVYCQARLKRTGEIIANSQPPYNIIGLTEVHPNNPISTCDGQAIVEGIQINGEYGSGKHRWGHPEVDWSFDGGLALFSTSKFDWAPYSEHAHRFSFDPLGRLPHGFIFSSIKVANDVSIDVYVTHLHSLGNWPTDCNRDCRYEELEELAKGIHERSEDSGNPVLVMGDFNIGGPSPSPSACKGNCGYGDIMDVLRNPRDLWSETGPTSPGHTHERSVSSVVDRRIDYIFVMTDPYFYNSKYEIFLAGRDEFEIVEWEMDDGNPVSDHLGLSATLEIRERVEPPPPECTPPIGPVVCAPDGGVLIE